MIRPLLSLKRLFFDDAGGKIRYQYSRLSSQEESMDYTEFIARVTSHIPDKSKPFPDHRTGGAVCSFKGLGRDDKEGL